MYARAKQFIGELVALLWMEKLFWLSFSVISVVVTGLLMSYPVGLLVSMLTHPETSLGFQPAFQTLLMINVWLLIGWMFTLDAIVTLWIWRSGFALKQLLRFNVLCHFLWRDSLYLAFALSLFLSRQVIPRTPSVYRVVHLHRYGTADDRTYFWAMFERFILPRIVAADLENLANTRPMHSRCFFLQSYGDSHQLLVRTVHLLSEFYHRCTGQSRHSGCYGAVVEEGGYVPKIVAYLGQKSCDVAFTR